MPPFRISNVPLKYCLMMRLRRHLIEVYWQNGDQYKARRLIRQLKKIDTPMPQTNDIIKKLDIRYESNRSTTH